MLLAGSLVSMETGILQETRLGWSQGVGERDRGEARWMLSYGKALGTTLSIVHGPAHDAPLADCCTGMVPVVQCLFQMQTKETWELFTWHCTHTCMPTPLYFCFLKLFWPQFLPMECAGRGRPEKQSCGILFPPSVSNTPSSEFLLPMVVNEIPQGGSQAKHDGNIPNLLWIPSEGEKERSSITYQGCNWQQCNLSSMYPPFLSTILFRECCCCHIQW